MHRVFSVFVASVLIIFSVPALSSENYDSQNTMSALNIAVVSVNKILTTQDKIVLEWEYDNIINRLALGNIQSDSEMKQLYQELLDFITKKKLRQEDSKRLRESYKQREREAYYKSMHEAFRFLRAPSTRSLTSNLTESNTD